METTLRGFHVLVQKLKFGNKNNNEKALRVLERIDKVIQIIDITIYGSDVGNGVEGVTLLKLESWSESGPWMFVMKLVYDERW